METQLLIIGEVAKQSGLPVSTLRFYEEKGLIHSIGRSGLHRIFEAAVLKRLALITLGRHAGFSLEEIASLFAPNSLNLDRDLLQTKADELDTRIKQLTVIRDGLRHAAVCSAPSHDECPKFQRLLDVAVKNQQRKTATTKHQRHHK